MKLLILTAFVLTISAAPSWAAEKVRYDDYRVYRLTPSTAEAISALRKLEEKSSEFNFWTSVKGINDPVDVMVPHYHVVDLEYFVQFNEIDMKLLNPNVQATIDQEGFRPLSKSGEFGWTDYYTIDEINQWLESLTEKYPGKVTLINGGSSYEGRNITGVRVSFSEENAQNAVFLEGNIHAREWITSAVATYILNELLTSTDEGVRALAESHDWYVFPIINPDGVAYTQETDRMWRKTRVPYGLTCYGSDPNRNWGYHWNEGGASNNPCSDTYMGPSAFSEPSQKSLSEYITTISDKLVGYISFHSYSQLLLIPYGYSAAHLDNFDELYSIGLKAADSLAQRYGTEYTVGNIVETIYVASGGSTDWVKGTFKTPVTYTYELRDTGRYGFILPADQIIPTGEETLDSLVTMFEEYDKHHK